MFANNTNNRAEEGRVRSMKRFAPNGCKFP